MVSGSSFPVLCGLCRQAADLTETITVHKSEIPVVSFKMFTFDGDRVEYTTKTTQTFWIPKWKYVQDERNENRSVGVEDRGAGLEACFTEVYVPFTPHSACVHICPPCQSKPIIQSCMKQRGTV